MNPVSKQVNFPSLDPNKIFEPSKNGICETNKQTRKIFKMRVPIQRTHKQINIYTKA